MSTQATHSMGGGLLKGDSGAEFVSIVWVVDLYQHLVKAIDGCVPHMYDMYGGVCEWGFVCNPIGHTSTVGSQTS